MVVFGAALGGLAAFGRRPNWPSDVQQWPSGQTKAALPPQGRADLRAAKRSACRRQEAPKKTSLPEIGKRRLP